MFADKINLTMSETMFVAVAGIAVVLLELAVLAVLIVFLSKILRLRYQLNSLILYTIEYPPIHGVNVNGSAR